MRVMVIVKATTQSEAGVMPTGDLLEKMGKFNEELVKAGVMLDGAGLKPTSQGKRLKFSGSARSVYDGPFTETKELIAGYWLWQVRSVEEAMEWLKKCPHPHPGQDCEIEIRPLYEEADFA
ncbi:MAG TPA: YciI family protein [Phycisphaerales bacterium]|nr:YciI family protein [Phycisphaerales bacterium]